MRTSQSVKPSEAQRVFVLQGGGALGAYQGGAVEVLAGAGIEPAWVAGGSIGAINAALIAGNPPELRLKHLRKFWDMVTAQAPWKPPPDSGPLRTAFDEVNAAVIATMGVPGFFRPRVPPAQFWPSLDPAQLSHYDTAPLVQTLRELVDFELLNTGPIRVSVGAVNVANGELRYFDTRHDDVIGPEHILASAALPPGFPAVKIGDDYWWDGGISSNTPLDHVLAHAQDDLLIFQLDLFSPKGALPTTLREAEEREKDIRFSSRTFRNTEKNEALHNTRMAIRAMIARLPADLRKDAVVAELDRAASETTVTVVHLIYQSRTPEVASRDYNFSRAAVDEHWAAGCRDATCVMNDRARFEQPQGGETMVTYQLDADCRLRPVRPRRDDATMIDDDKKDASE